MSKERFVVVGAHTIKDILNNNYLEIEDGCEVLNQQDQRIVELEEQLKNAIVPKFKVGQECYLIDNNFNSFHNRKKYNIVCSKIRKHKNVYYVKDYGINHEEDLFATKEEAEARLQELKGESE